MNIIPGGFTPELVLELKNIIRKVAQKNNVNAEGLLFSGGLDSSILAGINPNLIGITVNLKLNGEDLKYANFLAKYLNMKHYKRIVEIDEAINSIPEIIRVLKTFDPAIPNDIAVYFGLKQAKKLGMKSVMTGDGSDELFGGYSFMKDVHNLQSYIKRISKNMSFSSNELGKYFGIKIIQPFIDKNVVDFALKIPVILKIKENTGKWILRKAFEDLLPPEIVWQDKRPLESGSGMTKLRRIISLKIRDEEFEEKKKAYPVKFLNKEHLYYYEIYKKELGKIPVPKTSQKKCPGCEAGMKRDAFHCKICGYVINLKVNRKTWRIK
ncbi:MAG: asparagine synthase-related protein [Candidatus Firestonebacteria bacterium]